MDKTVEDLTIRELVEDLDYWIVQMHYRSPPMLDEMYEIIYPYIVELFKRTGNKATLEPKEPTLGDKD